MKFYYLNKDGSGKAHIVTEGSSLTLCAMSHVNKLKLVEATDSKKFCKVCQNQWGVKNLQLK